MRPAQNFRRALTIVAVMVVAAFALTAALGGSILLDHAAQAQQQPGAVPGDVSGAASKSDVWRELRQGISGTVSIPDKKSAMLIQSEGQSWRAFHDGPLPNYGGWAMLGIIIVLALFFAIRGRVKVEAGLSGRTIERFTPLERFAHWLMAGSFIVLAITGLNVLYGRYVLKPIIGQDVFATLTMWGKVAHNYLSFAFMIGVALSFLLWVAHNIPDRYDVAWVARAGGLFTKGSHPPAGKFNAGQKLIFWIVMLGGLSISLSGIALLIPFETHMFSATFSVLNIFGLDLPTKLAPIQEQQLNLIWHSMVGLFLIIVILAHIYVGTIGMQGAFDAMGRGQVDENWAREHHSVWFAETKGTPAPTGQRGAAAASAEGTETEADVRKAPQGT